MNPGIVISPKLIGELVILAVHRKKMEIQSHADHLDAVADYFKTDPQFEIADILHQGKIATVRFRWRHLDKETP